jgi:hypothetical protein
LFSCEGDRWHASMLRHIMQRSRLPPS